MNENVFYTFSQFYNVLFCTILIICTVLSFGYYYYRIKTKKTLLNITAFILLSSFICDFMSYTVVSLNTKIQLVNIRFILVIAHIIFVLIVALSPSKSKFKVYKRVYLIVSYTMILVLLFTYYERSVLVSIWLFVNFILLVREYVNKGMGAYIFRSVKKVLPNYVFVLGEKGEVFYTNDAVKNSAYFSQEPKINIENLNELFKADISIKAMQIGEFIKIDIPKPLYFAYTKKEIYSDGIVNGYILTFTDFTETLAMIDELNAHLENVHKANAELEDKKEKVYELEREREITYLLDKIANEQYKSMKKLRESISQLDLNSDDFEASLERLIHSTQADLRVVRATVSEYKNS